MYLDGLGSIATDEVYLEVQIFELGIIRALELGKLPLTSSCPCASPK